MRYYLKNILVYEDPDKLKTLELLVQMAMGMKAVQNVNKERRT